MPFSSLPRTREKLGNNFGMDGQKVFPSHKKLGHSETIQLITQLVLAVEPAQLSCGTAHSRGCSHYEEEYLIGSKSKKSSRAGEEIVRSFDHVQL
jgi:hypothetical protein